MTGVRHQKEGGAGVHSVIAPCNCRIASDCAIVIAWCALTLRTRTPSIKWLHLHPPPSKKRGHGFLQNTIKQVVSDTPPLCVLGGEPPPEPAYPRLSGCTFTPSKIGGMGMGSPNHSKTSGLWKIYLLMFRG